MGRADLKILDRMTGGETTGGEAEEPEPCLQAAFPQLVWVFLSNTLSRDPLWLGPGSPCAGISPAPVRGSCIKLECSSWAGVEAVGPWLLA